MQQVILNLMTNGIEATASVTGRERRLLLLTKTQNDGYVQVSVRDNGIGVRAETLGRLFEPFFTTRSQGDRHGSSHQPVNCRGSRWQAVGGFNL